MTIYRQGDVLIVATIDRPKGAKLPRQNGKIVLAEGEATGHAHVIEAEGADLYGEALESRFLEVLVEGGVDLIHQEHATITIPEGVYRVVRQREWTPEALRIVSD